jgi:hypothetical protein
MACHVDHVADPPEDPEVAGGRLQPVTFEPGHLEVANDAIFVERRAESRQNVPVMLAATGMLHSRYPPPR